MKSVIIIVLTIFVVSIGNCADCNHTGIIKSGTSPLECTPAGNNPKKIIKKVQKKSAKKTKNKKKNKTAVNKTGSLKTEKEKKELPAPF